MKNVINGTPKEIFHMEPTVAYPAVSIIIVDYHSWKNTIECLESVFRLDYDNYAVIVIDNDNDRESIEKIKLWASGELSFYNNTGNPLYGFTFPPVPKPIPYVEYNRSQAENGGDIEHDRFQTLAPNARVSLVLINSGENLGFAGGNNIGLKYVLKRDDCDYVWLLNNDTVVTPSTLKEMIFRMKDKPTSGMCGSTISYYHNPESIQAFGGGSYNRWLGWTDLINPGFMKTGTFGIEKVERRLSFISGVSMLVTHSFLETVGLMGENYFLYFEEIDWATRAGKRFSMTYAPGSLVFHKAGATIKSDGNISKISKRSEFYIQRNKIIFTKKFFPYALPTIYLGLLLALLKRLCSGQWDHAAMLLKIVLGLKETDYIVK